MDEDMFSGVRGEVAGLRDELDLLTSGAEKASRTIEIGLLRAVRTGKLGFEDLGKIALSVMAQIAQSRWHGWQCGQAEPLQIQSVLRISDCLMHDRGGFVASLHRRPPEFAASSSCRLIC